MKPEDRDLGLGRAITRRDFLQGLGALSAAAWGPGLLAQIGDGKQLAYPPSLTGLRGSHPGSFEVAHELGRMGRKDWGPTGKVVDDIYDLVVVGAGISGLAAAFIYRQQHPDARILILDNHDDFGGHAKRNEFQVGNHHLLGYGGSQTLEEPSSYPENTRKLLAELGVDLERFYTVYDQRFFRRHGLAGATFFDRKRWGENRLVPYELGGLGFTLPLAKSLSGVKDAVDLMPLSDAAKKQMHRLLTDKADRLPGLSQEQRRSLLESISYRHYLEHHLKISEPDVFDALAGLTTDLGGDIDSVGALSALQYIGLPGYGATGLPDLDDNVEPYIHHFPDGNASIARLLVRRMVPSVAPGDDMDDLVLAKFDYAQLDQPDGPVRLRLNSTVVDVRHDASSAKTKLVHATYINNGSAHKVCAKRCIMACYNAMIPSICSELPEPQKQGLASGVKIPILYTNVALTNWHAWKKLGVGAISAPGSYHINAMLDFPVSLGGYSFSDKPDAPIVAHMERFFHQHGSALTKREQAPLGRREMLATPFATIERNIRQQLADMLGEGGFDPARDIAGITVNRWPHGYATRDWLEDEYFEDRNDLRYGHVRGRQRFGQITIANSDAGALATIESAIEQAFRAVADFS